MAIYVVYVLENLATDLDTTSIHTALALCFLLAVITTLSSTMLPKLRAGKKNAMALI